jgi:acyl-CoA reductase-like NAD-dependent aldehyde dehydrogenase
VIAVENPATGRQVGSVPELSSARVAELVGRARAAQEGWAAVGFPRRAGVLAEAQRWFAEHADRVIRTIMSETGKTWEDAQFSELLYICEALRFWARRSEAFLADERVRSSSPFARGKRLVLRHEPVGVVGVISPWNYPLALPLGDALPALMAGNAVVIKPSEVTPLTSVLGAEALRECGLPEGVLQIATGRGETGAALVDQADMVAFTGSVATGRMVMERASRTLTPVSLELGGKDPLIVLRDADLERAANAAVYYSMWNSGQTCISVERAYVEEPVYDEFVAKVVEKVGRLRQGDPSAGPGTVEVGAITHGPQIETVARHVDGALAAGARALTGGGRRPGGGTFFEPTVLVDVTHEMECAREETFGPTLPIVKVRDPEEAVALANDSSYGLGASVFAGDAGRGEEVARRLQAGNVAVNDALAYYAVLDLPMGGWKASGIGKRHGPPGIRKYCRQQTLLVTRRALRREPHMFPYRRILTRASLRLLRLAYGRRPAGRLTTRRRSRP